MYNSTTNSFTVTGLNPTTQYCFTVLAKDQAGNTSAQSIQDCETTLMTGANGSSCVMEDFENIGTSEGSYATRDWNDANGSAWQATDARTDLSITSKSITIRNGSLTSPTISGGIGNLTVTTKRYFGGSSGSFSVFINGSATSVGSIPYGNENEVITTTISNINIQGNISIVLTNSSSSNRIAIDDLNWTCYSVLSSDSFTKQDFTLYPNPVTSNQLNINSKKDLNVSIYNLLGKRVFNTFAFKGKNSLNLKDLKSGIYLIKLSSNDKLITKKLIIK